MTNLSDFDPAETRFFLLEQTTEIVCAYVSQNAIPAAELPVLISRVYQSLDNVSLPQQPTAEPAAAPVPAVPIKKSIADDYLICLEDGKRFKSLKRHLMSQYKLTPAAYREKWGLGPDYPLVAPAYARARSALAKEMGLGSQRNKAVAVATPRKPTKAAA